MSLPRILSLGERNNQIVLKQQPVKEIESLRVKEKFYKNISGNSLSTIPMDKKGANEIVCVLNHSGSGKAEFLFHFNDEEKIVIRCDNTTNKIELNRGNLKLSNFDPNFSALALANLPETENIDLRIIIDRSIIEIFALGGEYVFTSQFFPTALIDRLVIKQEGGIICQHV